MFDMILCIPAKNDPLEKNRRKRNEKSRAFSENPIMNTKCFGWDGLHQTV